MHKVLEYLDSKNYVYSIKGDEAIMNCPFCEDTEKKFAINTETGYWQCWHKNRCGKSGSLYELKKKLGDVAPIIYKQKVYHKPKEISGRPNDKMIAWFLGRGILKDTVEKYHIRSEGNAVVFPFFKDGKIVNQKYRTGKKEFRQEKDAEPVLFGRDLVSLSMTELIIVEGEIDCMTMFQYGFEFTASVPAGANNLSWIETEWDWLERFDPIYLCLDNDPAGKDATQKIAKRLGQWRCRWTQLPFKDANDCLQNFISKDEITECLIKSKDMRPDTVRMAEEYFDEMLQKEPEALASGFSRFDTILGGFRNSEVTVWTGRNGDGKTTLLNQIVLNILRKYTDQKICMASFEMLPKWLLRWMCSQANIIVCKEGLEEFRKITDGRLALIDTQTDITVDALLNAFEYLAKRYGMQTFIIDSLLRVNITGGQDWLENQKNFMNRLTQFALTHEAHIHLVAHPRKGTSDDSRISKVDIAGSGDIGNLAFNVVSIKRMKNVPEDANLEVMKNRQTGRLGQVALLFNSKRKLFSEPVE